MMSDVSAILRLRNWNTISAEWTYSRSRQEKGEDPPYPPPHFGQNKMELLFVKYFFGYRRAADTRVGKKDWVNFSFCFPIISQLQKGMIFSENTTLKVCLSGEETGFRNREVTNQCSQSSHETYHHDRKVNIHTSIYPRSLDVSCPTLETRPVLEKTFLFSRRPQKTLFLKEIRTLKKRDLF